MKYLIQKGYRGFGDRLTHLIYCVKIAIESNRKIYIDWNDHYWNHTGENFYTYFKLLDIGIENTNNLGDLSVSPNFWKNNLDANISPSNFAKIRDQEKISSLSSIIKKYPDEDVLVIINGFRKTFADISFFSKIFRVKDDRIITAVKELQEKYNLKECTGIHLRGTDRKREKHVTNSDILKKLFMKIKSTDIIVCFTDDIELFNEFKRKVPLAVLLTKIVVDSPNNGSHQIPPNLLKKTKDEMNVDLLTDFFALASCKKQYSTFEESTFYQMSIKIHPHVDIILGNGK
jgi:hypothetical protein